jgi:sigma-B regulation protein RsbU (phosphoserine phosphatase)
MLHKHGFSNLLAVESAEEAREKIDNFQPELMILDIELPGMNGFDYCRDIRHHPQFRDLPVLFQTASIEIDTLRKAFEVGATDFISKPVYPDELHARVNVHLQNRVYTKSLQQYQERVNNELESARMMQQSILPQPNEIHEIGQRCMLDIASYFKPSSEIGGDFWGIKTLFPQQAALWMVDFSGHGVAGAINAFRLHAYVKEHSPLSSQPGNYLSHLNDKLLHIPMRGQFATRFYAIIDTATSQLFYSFACSPQPLILRGVGGNVDMIDSSGSLLGVGMHSYITENISFYKGDTLLLYSDALVETPNAEGIYINTDDLISLLHQHQEEGANIMMKRILDHYNQHTGGLISDYLTICICKRK